MAKSSFFKDGGAGTNTAAAIQNQLDQAAASAAQAATSLNSIGTELADATAARVAAEAAQAAAETAKTASEAARDTAITNRNAADASATAASTSESNSQNSENNASSSASAAATSAQNASTSEGNAATSASNAATSASNASTSEGNASTSASNAAASETASQTAQTASETAKTASEAARDLSLSYRNTAETHKNSAAASATAAATSENNASTSEGNAASSASAASGSASSAASAQTAAEAARDSALAAFDSFDDRYLGAKSSDPTTDNDGDALVAGSLVYNTTSSIIKVWTGSAWVAAYVSGGSFAQLSGATFTGDVTVPNLITAGNVDGRDVSADGTKLDGISTGADVTPSWVPASDPSYLTSVPAQSFSSLTGKPTTIAGYGITDAFDGATTSLTGTNFSASSAFQFLNGGAAQDIKTRSVYAGTSYSAATSNAGEMDALNGYRVAGGTVINNSRVLFHGGQYNYSDTNQWIWWTGQSYGNIRMAGGNAGGYSGIEFSDSASDTTLMIRNSDGLNGIYRADAGSWFWYSDSSNHFRSYGNVTAYASDERLKTNFKPIQSALEKVCSLDGVSYEWDKEACERTDFTPEFNKTELGFKAQQVQKYFPEVAVLAPFDTDPMGEGVNQSKSGENYLTLHYERLVPALVEAIKELKAEVEELKAGCCHGST